jgi:hypothetical protein
MLRPLVAFMVLTSSVAQAQAAAKPAAYPSRPKPLGEAEEIALAISAAPEEVSGHADVYVLRDTAFARVRTGTNGCACVVGRDSHEGSRYPICFDQEGARTLLFREMLEGSLRARGLDEDAVRRAVDAAFARGELRLPARAALAYMMSPRQILFSSPDAGGVRVGAWSPHLMITLPGVPLTQIGLAEQSKVDIVQINNVRGSHSELVVKVPKWSDGKPVTTP